VAVKTGLTGGCVQRRHHRALTSANYRAVQQGPFAAPAVRLIAVLEPFAELQALSGGGPRCAAWPTVSSLEAQ